MQRDTSALLPETDGVLRDRFKFCTGDRAIRLLVRTLKPNGKCARLEGHLESAQTPQPQPKVVGGAVRTFPTCDPAIDYKYQPSELAW